MNNLKIISGSSNEALAEAIAKYLDTSLVNVTRDKFGDGETFVQINENIRGCDVFIIQSTNSPANDNLMELLIMIDAAKRASAGSITAVVPFFGYARQDRKDKPRVPITAKLVTNMIVAAGADRIMAMDLHSAQIQGFADIPFDNLFASPILTKYIKDNVDCDIIISPDAGGIKRAEALANALGVNFGFVAKERINDENVTAKSIIGRIKGQNVVIVDDMTESLGTLIEAAKLCHRNGAKFVTAAVTHAPINSKGRERLQDLAIRQLFLEIIITNTVRDNDYSVVTRLDVSGLFGEAIKRTHNGDSVTDLFEVKGF